jgi:DNA-directed RNA polymerase subunit RPC12/RpoP
MLDLPTCLRYYQRKEIQEELVFNAKSRELGVRYANGEFGKRPDILNNNADVLEFAKQGVSSFHISEEIWRNPLALSPSLSKKELDPMRQGWDLIIDIDCPDWDLSRRIADVIIKVLYDHNVSSVSCKFSGNKGFHIGVPFEAFPENVQGKNISLLFPEGVKRILDYISHYAEKHYSSQILAGADLKKALTSLGLIESDVIFEKCAKCNTKIKPQQEKHEYFCTKCGVRTEKQEYLDYISCPKCKSVVKISSSASSNKKCPSCKSTVFLKEISLRQIMGLDQILISPRHLYRMAYSLHEKSGLVSLPLDPKDVLHFDKQQALPEKVSIKHRFLDPAKLKRGEASDLILKALDFKPEISSLDKDNIEKRFRPTSQQNNIEQVQQKLPLELFPPCITNILKGMKDGKKRALFVLTNFLSSVGWNNSEIEQLIYDWNKKNEEALRETLIKTHLNYRKTHQKDSKSFLPPNCSNKIYYLDMGVCIPDTLCPRIKNPAAYSQRKAYLINSSQPKKKKKEEKEAKSSTKEKA